MFYEHLLRAKITKAQKDIDGLTDCLFALLGFVYIKAAHKHIG